MRADHPGELHHDHEERVQRGVQGGVRGQGQEGLHDHPASGNWLFVYKGLSRPLFCLGSTL